MATYLLTWNPKNFEWPTETIQLAIQRIYAGESVVDTWNTGVTRRIVSGDEFLLIRLGQEPEGIIGAGVFVSDVYEADHGDADRTENGETSNYARISFTELLDPWTEQPLSHDRLTSEFPSVHWSPQGSGSSIDDEIATEVQVAWQLHLKDIGRGPLPLAKTPEQVRESIAFFTQALRDHNPAGQFGARNPNYFVHDPDSGDFAPAKWAAFPAMTKTRYVALQKIQNGLEGHKKSQFRSFGGDRTQKHLRQLTGQEFQENAQLLSRMNAQYVAAYGDNFELKTGGMSRSFLTLPPSRPRRYWWANQGRTFAEESAGGYVWAPQRGRNDSSPSYYWTNVSEIRPGDRIFSHSKGTIVAVGTATSKGRDAERPYELPDEGLTTKGWSADVSYDRLAEPIPLSVISQAHGLLELPRGPLDSNGVAKQGYLFELSPEIAAEMEALMGIKKDTVAVVETMKPINLIFYGPPGTGKTFRSVAEAVRICDGQVPEERADVEIRFRELCVENRIAVTTFHQSYGYEDFVEGLRPVLGDSKEAADADSSLRFSCQSGIFKKLCSWAEAPTGAGLGGADDNFNPDKDRIWKMSMAHSDAEESEAYETRIEQGYLALGYGRGLDFSDCESLQAIQDRLRPQQPPNASSYEAEAVHRFKNQLAEGDYVVIPDGLTGVRAIGRVAGKYEPPRDGPRHQIRRVRWLRLFEPAIPREKVYTKQFIRTTIYTLRSDQVIASSLNDLIVARPQAPLPHVLIIDEINRGNVSKILGELITLLEPDKRIGMPHELRLTLPFSGERFGVPANLHVIGTMNTADRSIAFLDTALRRRFRFEEILPDVEVVRDRVGSNGELDGVNVPRLMETINSRVELLYDRDHTIGHSYFLGIKTLEDLRDAFLFNIIPLLQEYFYEDWSKVSMVLGCPFDPETAKAQSKNSSPMIQATALEVTKLPGGRDSDLENGVRFELSSNFRLATGNSLRPYFDQVVGE